MIDTNNWSQFDCRELFECKNTGNILARDVIDGSGSTPYVTASAYNNGVVSHIDATNYEIIKGHCILVGGKTFTITYQKDDFVSNDSHNFTVRVKDYGISDYSYLYLATIIYKYFGQKYSWNDAVTKDKLMDERLPLPTTPEGKPDWDYMESYMKSAVEEAEKSLDVLEKADNTKHLIDVSEWGEFKIGDLFDIDTGSDLILFKAEDGDIPVVSHSAENNGIQKRVGSIPNRTLYDHTNTLSLADRGNFKCFVQDEDFYIGTRVKALISKTKVSKLCMLFLTTMIDSLAIHFSYKDNATGSLGKHIIKLPITSTGEPDWQYMEDYMRIIMEESEQIISDLQIGA